ncbi:CoA-transferase [Enemella dayhoffiae]|uniref:CoA-transferase n=1 Tax=Enemella dayhoffiae TaxID=2016507 RepID=A0A255GLG6_9ACTN|nr:CoA-transferase [Enemella dayhoffiae]OYO16675.1 CoA-transferase [Enemella dayhoffiae]
MSDPTRAEVCAVACAEVFRDDGEILVSAFGIAPAIGARLARATFSPDLAMSDGEAHLIAGVEPLGSPGGTVEGWTPFRQIFDLVWGGKRHAMMIPTQIDAFGNANTAVIGDYRRPKVQLIGVRGLPGNTVNHPCSYWVPKHSRRVFVEQVDMVAGVGNDAARRAGSGAARHHDLRRVVTNLAVFDFGGEQGRMRLVSRHPGVTMEELREATGFDLGAEEVPETRLPTEQELQLIRQQIDPRASRDKEVPA